MPTTSKNVAQADSSPGMVVSQQLQSTLYGQLSMSQMQPVSPDGVNQAVLAAITALETRIVALGG